MDERKREVAWRSKIVMRQSEITKTNGGGSWSLRAHTQKKKESQADRQVYLARTATRRGGKPGITVEGVCIVVVAVVV